MNSIGRRKFIFGAVSCFFAACYSGKEDRGVENIRRELIEKLNSELKESGLNIIVKQVNVSKTGTHTYKAEMLFIINYNRDKKVTVDLPEGFDLRGKIVPEILFQLGIPQKKLQRIRPRRFENYVQKPARV